MVVGQRAHLVVALQDRRQNGQPSQLAPVEEEVSEVVQRMRAADLAEVDQACVAAVAVEDVARIEVAVREPALPPAESFERRAEPRYCSPAEQRLDDLEARQHLRTDEGGVRLVRPLEAGTVSQDPAEPGDRDTVDDREIATRLTRAAGGDGLGGHEPARGSPSIAVVIIAER